MHRNISTSPLEKFDNLIYHTFYSVYGSQQQINNKISTTEEHEAVTTYISIRNYTIHR